MKYFLITDDAYMEYRVTVDSDIVTAEFLVSMVPHTRAAVEISKEEYDKYEAECECDSDG